MKAVVGQPGEGPSDCKTSIFAKVRFPALILVLRTTKEGTEKEGGKCKELKRIAAGDSVTMSSTVSLLSSSGLPGKRVDTSTDTVKVGAGSAGLVRGWELGIIGACEVRNTWKIELSTNLREASTVPRESPYLGYHLA